MLGEVLRGRASECAQLDELLAAVRDGRSGALVLHGEAGIGKTALLDYVAAAAYDMRLLRTEGVEAEMELPFAAVQQLCAPLLGSLERLPPPQRDALQSALGLSASSPPDQFLVGLAVLTLLSDAATTHPLGCLVDDAHWLDHSSARVLSFVARRIEAEGVLLVFAQRDPHDSTDLDGLPELRLQRLSFADAREVLDSASPGVLDEGVRDRFLAEAHGNPLALIELSRALDHVSLAGGFAVSATTPLDGPIETVFRQQAQALPQDTQRLLLLAAAEPLGDPALLWRAGEMVGLSSAAVAPAEASELLAVDARVTFRHPLLRSAIYGAAQPEQRRAAHAALAEATDPAVDPDRRAWHRANATLAPDEDVAAELEHSAQRAIARGGLAAAAAFLERAAALSPDDGNRAGRGLAAAEAKHLAGAPEAASILLAAALAGPLDARESALALRLKGLIALQLRRPLEATPALLDAAERLEAIDPGLARETYLEALRARNVGGRLGGEIFRRAAEASLNAPPPEGAPRAVDLLLDGLAVRFTDGVVASAPMLERALGAVRDEDGRVDQDVRLPGFAARVAFDAFDDQNTNALLTRFVALARERGALGVLPLALQYLAILRTFEGELVTAAALLDESDAIADATGATRIGFTRMTLAGFRGDEAALSALVEAAETVAVARGEGGLLTFGEHARAVLNNGLGHYEAALRAAESAGAHDEFTVSAYAQPELIEAAVRSGADEAATVGLERLAERTHATPTPTDLALGLEARSRALLSQGEAADQLYRESIARLGLCRFAPDRARAHLLYGEWLRREGRRTDAREQLHTAHDMLASIGMEAFAERARRELLATGEKARKRTADTRDDLTPQEAEIAKLARDGHTNPEIGALLFLSPRTVEWHLRHVFQKLDISSRRQLRVVLADR
jgi:DNA-binding CsgD family transcriptional regulator